MKFINVRAGQLQFSLDGDVKKIDHLYYDRPNHKIYKATDEEKNCAFC